MEKIIKENKRWILFFIAIISFIAILFNILEKGILDIDIKFYSFLSEHVICDNLTIILKIVTQLGGVIFISVLSILCLAFIKNRKIGFSIWLNAALTGLLNSLIKFIVKRPRPEGFRLIDETGYSFPSGHTMASICFYGFIIYLILRYVKNKKVKILSCILLTFLIFIIPLSRIYLGVHYTSDVLAGAFFSISYLIVYISIVSKKL